MNGRKDGLIKEGRREDNDDGFFPYCKIVTDALINYVNRFVSRVINLTTYRAL
jgi:hypothetical protein